MLGCGFERPSLAQPFRGRTESVSCSARRLLPLVACSLLAAWPAVAEEEESAARVDTDFVHPYVTLTAGTSSVPSLDADENLGRVSIDGLGWTAGGGVGVLYGYTRHEIRADYHQAEVDDVTPGLGPGTSNPSGDTLGVTTILYTLAARYPFALLELDFEVYAGGGMGAAYGRIPIQGSEIDDWKFGYAALGGVHFRVWRELGIDVGYRYVAATEFEDEYPISPPPVPGFPSEDRFAVSWEAHEVTFSLQYRFGAGE